MRGGGEGGVDDRVVAVSARVNACAAADGQNATPVGVTGSAETPEHLSMQSPNFAQPFLVCLSQ